MRKLVLILGVAAAASFGVPQASKPAAALPAVPYSQIDFSRSVATENLLHEVRHYRKYKRHWKRRHFRRHGRRYNRRYYYGRSYRPRYRYYRRGCYIGPYGLYCSF